MSLIESGGSKLSSRQSAGLTGEARENDIVNRPLLYPLTGESQREDLEKTSSQAHQDFAK
jgi:hypothetical protein